MTVSVSRILGQLTATMPCMSFTLAIAILLVTGDRTNAGDTSVSATPVSSTTVAKPPKEHPLEWALDYAESQAKHIRESIDDYSCRLIKRERINGKLQPYQFAEVQVRCGRRRDGRVERPMALFMRFLGPATMKDRRVLYVEGQHDGKILVRKGGASMKFLRLELDPLGQAARRESKYPVTELGFNKIIQRLIQITENDIRNDPQGINTNVKRFRNAKIGERTCTHIRVEHPNKTEGIDFYRASLYVDDEMLVPIRLVVHGWPEGEDDKPPLIEEYIYDDLKLNVGLTDEDFSESRLE